VQPARLGLARDSVTVTLDTPEPGIAPGQACVFYDSATPLARVLGGGTIAATTAAVDGDVSAARNLTPEAYITH
jgi:tRNA-specific 2-thiouridylase